MGLSLKHSEVISLECPCCGDDAWIGTEKDLIADGTLLICGCKGHISVDSESDPYVSTWDCDCSA